MKKNWSYMKKAISIMLVLCMIISLAACSKESTQTKTDTQDQTSNNANQNEVKENEVKSDEEKDTKEELTKEVELLVDLHGWMPTLNTEPTAENPTVFRSPQDIADKFQELYPNITIKWARNKPVGGLQTELAEWFTTQINAGTVPAIAFSWGTQYQDRGWYLPLDEYLDTPNEFVDGNTKWRDLFPEYLWSSNTIANANKQVVAIPIALYPGPATGYFYNKTAFTEAGIKDVPKTWDDYCF